MPANSVSSKPAASTPDATPRTVSRSTRAPRVTIGVPVYNGAATLEFALRSLMAQTYRDIEILISDNGSTDETPQILARLAAEDPRIRVVRQPTNLGANGNYSYVAREARGEFLKWASASDWVHPTMIEKCVAAIDTDPGAVLAAPRTRLFHVDLDHTEEYERDLTILGESPLDRISQWFALGALNNAFNGVIRLSALRRTRVVPAYMSADLVLMGHLALLGRFILVDEPLYFRRMDIETSTCLQPEAERIRHHYPKVTARTLFQEWKHQFGWLRVGLTAPMPLGERVQLLLYLARRCFWKRAELWHDLTGAVRFAFSARR